jgi:glycosyltransferase involved in cell wall biosynthesis
MRMSDVSTANSLSVGSDDRGFGSQTAPQQNAIGDREPQPKQGAPLGRRVLIIVENLPVPFDRRVWSEATTLTQNGYDVSVICPKGRGATASFEVIDGVRIYRHWLPSEGQGLLGYLAEYGVALFWEFVLSCRILMTQGFDVIHACNPPDLIFLIGGFHKIFFGKRFIFDHHDINPELYEAKFGRRGLLWRIVVLLERLSFASADVSIATNDSYRRIAIERGKMKPERVFVVRSGPNLARLCSVPADMSWSKGRRFLVAYVGVIGKQEGLDLLLEAVKHIRDARSRDDVQFVVIGDGPEFDNVRKLSTALGLDETVTFSGRVEDKILFTILSTADVCVNPDRPNAMNDKSTMNKIMEYMAFGKPIVQFDLTEGRISAGEASIYVRNADTAEFGDKILELVDDPERRALMGAFGRERVHRELTWNHAAPNLLEAYECAFTGPVRAARGNVSSATRTLSDGNGS